MSTFRSIKEQIRKVRGCHASFVAMCRGHEQLAVERYFLASLGLLMGGCTNTTTTTTTTYQHLGERGIRGLVHLKKVFVDGDADQDGQLTFEEFASVLR